MLKSILLVILVTAGLIICLIFGQAFYKLVQILIWRNHETICIAPGELYFKIGSVLLFTFIVGIWGLVSLITKKINFKRNIKKGQYIIGVISCLAVILPVLAINKCTIFKNEFIIHQKEIPWRKSIYAYDQIQEVRVSRFKGLHYNRIIYVFITTDGEKIDLTTDNYNIRYIGNIEDKISDTIPHVITSDAYDSFTVDIDKIARWKVIQ